MPLADRPSSLPRTVRRTITPTRRRRRRRSRPQADPRLTLTRPQREGLAQVESRTETTKRRTPRTTVHRDSAETAVVRRGTDAQKRRERKRLKRLLNTGADPRQLLNENQRRGLAQEPSRRRQSRERARFEFPQGADADAFPALQVLAESRGAEGRILTPDEFEQWRVREGRFSRDLAPGSNRNIAPTYNDYLDFIENRRGFDTAAEETPITSRVERGKFRSPAQERRELNRLLGGRTDPRLYGRTPDTTEEALALNERNAVEREDDGGFSFPDIAGWLGGKIKQHVADPIADRLADELGFGGGNVTGPMRLGNRTVSLVPESGRSNVIARDLASAGAESVTRRAVSEAVETAGIPGLAIEQVAESFLYQPAFVAEFLRNPKDAMRGLVETAKYAAQHPTERPGDIIALVWAGGGGLFGAMSRLSRLKSGGVRAAAAPSPSTKAVPDFLRPPGSRGRVARRERNVIADLRAADTHALQRANRRPVVDRVTAREFRDATGRSSRGLIEGPRNRDIRKIMEDEAIRSQYDQVTPQERRALFQEELPAARTRADAKRLQRRIDALDLVIARGMVEGEPPNVHVVHPRVAELAELGARVSDEQAALKDLLQIVSRETQESHLYDPGAIFRRQDRVPGEPFHMVTPDMPGVETARLAQAEAVIELRQLNTERQRVMDQTVVPAERSVSRVNPELSEQLRGFGYTDAEIAGGLAWAEQNIDFARRSPNEFQRYLGSKVATGDKARQRRTEYDPEGQFKSRQHSFAARVYDAYRPLLDEADAARTSESPALAEIDSRIAAAQERLDSAEAEIAQAEEFRPSLRGVESLERRTETAEGRAETAEAKIAAGSEKRPMTPEEAVKRKKQVDRQLAPYLDQMHDRAVYDIYGSTDAMRAEQARMNRQSASKRARSTTTGSRVSARVQKFISVIRRSDDPAFAEIRALLDEQEQLNRFTDRSQPDPFGLNEGLPDIEAPLTDGLPAPRRKTLEEQVATNRRIARQLREAREDAVRLQPTMQRLTPGKTYAPYKINDLARTNPSISTRVFNTITRRRPPTTHRMSGEAIRTGKYGNAIDMVAKEALDVLRYRESVELWKEAVPLSKSATELLNEIKAGRAKLDDYVPVRTGTGSLTPESRMGIRFTTNADQRTTNFFGTLDEYGKERFAELAEQIDLAGEVRFVHKDIGTEPVVFSPKKGFLRNTVGLVNQFGRFVTFPLGFTAWLVPNVIGQAAAATLHQGLAAIPQIIHSTRVVRGAPRGVARQRLNAALDQIGGTGFVAATNPGAGPWALAGRVNEWVGEKYGFVMDQIWRRNATLYELRIRGYDSTAKVTKAVRDAKRDPQGKAARDVKDVAEAVDQNYGAFRHMSDYEKNTLTDLIFIYPWLRVSAELAAKFPVNHPVKAGVLTLGGSHANEKAREDFIALFVEQGLTQSEAESAAQLIMERMPGIFLMGDSAISPMAIALLSTPGELLAAVDPFMDGDWKRGVFNSLDFGSPAVSVFKAAAASLWNPFSPGLPVELEEELGSFARDYTLAQRLQEGGSAWFSYTPGQAVGARVFGSFFARGVKGEGVLESVKKNEEIAAEALRASLSPEQRAYRDVFDVREQYRQLALDNGLGGEMSAPIKTAFNRHAERLSIKKRIVADLGDGAYVSGTRAYSLEAYKKMTAADIGLLRKWGVLDAREASAALETVAAIDNIGEIKEVRDAASRNEFREALLPYYDARDFLRDKFGIPTESLPNLPS